ncbi:MAG: hypothetical protein KBT20_09900 [Bacteroidales bacterium]|nr:hypothetical protein [Candidatus Liminaster caballi]
MITLNDFQKLFENGSSFLVKSNYEVYEPWFKEDTIKHISEIVGKKVAAYTKGYMDQYDLQEFTVGGIAPKYKFFNEQSQPKTEEEVQKLIEKYGYVVIDQKGDSTGIFIDELCNGIFCCSDADRFTNFVILDEDPELPNIDQLADLINISEEFPIVIVDAAIEKNGWQDDRGETWGICRSDKAVLEFNEEGVAVVFVNN